MSLVDLFIIIAFLVPAMAGLFMGSLRMTIRVFLWVGAVALAVFVAVEWEPYVPPLGVDPATRWLILILACFFVIHYVLVFFLRLLLLRIPRGETLTSRLGGALLGLGLGYVTLFSAVLAASLTPMPRQNWWPASVLLVYLSAGCPLVRPALPSAVAEWHRCPQKPQAPP